MWYCSKEHQQEAWKLHKQNCKAHGKMPAEQPQILNIANFPPRIVSRLPDWNWKVFNENVVLVSFFSSTEMPQHTAPDFGRRMADLIMESPTLHLVLSHNAITDLCEEYPALGKRLQETAAAIAANDKL